MKKPETKFKERVLKDLKTLKNTWFFKTQEVGRRGVPDILLCLNGLFVAIELKIEGGKVDKLQEHNIDLIKSSNGMGFIIVPAEWPQLFESLKNLCAAVTSTDEERVNAHHLKQDLH